MSEDRTPSGGHGDSARSSILEDKNRTTSDTGRIEDSDRTQSRWDVFAKSAGAGVQCISTPQSDGCLDVGLSSKLEKSNGWTRGVRLRRSWLVIDDGRLLGRIGVGRRVL